MDEHRQRFPEDGALIEAIFFPATEMVITLDQSLHTDVVQRTLPKKLGRYVIQRLLGQGGVGVVYLAHDPQLDRFVALKIPRRERFTTVEQVTNFIQEARTAAKLKHPGLVAVHDVQVGGRTATSTDQSSLQCGHGKRDHCGHRDSPWRRAIGVYWFSEQ